MNQLSSSLTRRALRGLALTISAAALAACGGGGGDEACSTETVLSLTVSWDSNGAKATSVNGRVGVPLVATPIITGIPASCRGKESFTGATSVYPAGLQLNTTTGVISGTPTQAVSVGGPDMVTLHLPGYSSVRLLGGINIAP